MNVLVELEEFVDMCFEDLCGFFDKEIEKSEKGAATINLGDTLQFLAMDVVGEIAFGQTFGGSGFRDIRLSQLTICTGRFDQGWLRHGRLPTDARRIYGFFVSLRYVQRSIS